MEETMAAERSQTDRRQRVREKRKRGKFDYTLFSIVMILLVIGMIMVYSTSYYSASLKYDGDAAHWLKRQAIFALGGLGVMYVFSRIDYHVWKSMLTTIAYGVVLVLLVLVLAVGKDVNGAKRWLQLGSISIQPSEIAKVVVIVFFAALLTKYGRRIRNYKDMAICISWMLPIIALVGIENMSTAIIIILIIGIMIFVVMPKLTRLIPLVAVGVLMCLYMLFAQSYRGNRVKIWLNPEAYDKGYQTMQALYAIGSGGLTGKGLGQSLQKLGFIPEAHNDMIFSIICEELGFFGAMGVILLFVVLIYRMIKIAINAQDLYGSLIVVGSIAHIGCQVLINIAVVTNSIPNTGVPLPFISYGGTSIAFLLAEIGLVLSVGRTVYREK